MLNKKSVSKNANAFLYRVKVDFFSRNLYPTIINRNEKFIISRR